MKLHMYSVKDVKTGLFTRPMSFIGEADVFRAVYAACDGGDDTISRFPADYEVWFVGKFDDNTGVVEGDLEFVTSVVAVKERFGGYRKNIDEDQLEIDLTEGDRENV